MYQQAIKRSIRTLVYKGALLSVLSWLQASVAVAYSDLATIGARLSKVPVLCYHQVRNWTKHDSREARTYIIPPATFRQHVRSLQENGFHSILPDQLLDFVQTGKELPPRAILICFDDGTISQLENALPVLDMASYKAAFFIMTVALNKPGYFSNHDIRTLAAQGHEIGCHTWDHHDVRHYTDEDWKIQLEKPSTFLRQLTGKQVSFFAYPFGAWNSGAFQPLKRQAYRAAFQLLG